MNPVLFFGLLAVVYFGLLYATYLVGYKHGRADKAASPELLPTQLPKTDGK